MPTQHDGKVVVFAPFARDAQSLVAALKSQHVDCEAVPDLVSLTERLGDEVGAVILTEEALSQHSWQPLVDAANDQPSWSAYPFILLIGQRRSLGQSQAVYSVLPSEITNVMVLERPTGLATLTSAVRWALAGRRRQFVTRNHLAELERNAQQQRLMTRELAHRVKNTIAVLQSIVRQTIGQNPGMQDVRNQIIERFSALGRAHDLLLGSNFEATDFQDLVARALSVHVGKFNVNGENVQLSPQASLSFALVLHELATNSIKYGALLRDTGSVDINWWVRGEVEPHEFVFHWRERDGPLVSKPSSSGFGTRLIKSTLSGLGKMQMTYEPTGFVLAFEGGLSGLTHSVVPDFNVETAQRQA